MKKIIALCLAACIGVCSLASCGDTPEPIETTAETKETNYKEKNNVLENCVGLADENGVYVVPDHITAIAESAFAGDTTLKEIVIGSNVKTIGAGAFQYCTSLRKVTIADGVESIGSHAFYGCSLLEIVDLPATIEKIESYVFYGCEALETISLENVSVIDNAAFWYCTSLIDVAFSKNLTKIGDWAFAQCQSLQSTNLEECENLTTIGDYAFAACPSLRSITFPNSMQHIGMLVFYGCTRLYNVTIPNSLTSIDFGAFNYTPWYQEQDADYLIVGDGVLLRVTVRPETIDLANKGIKHIAGSAFWNAEFEGAPADYGYKYAWELENIVIPEGVLTIGTSAFGGCMLLKNVTLPSTLVSIGDNAFNVYMEGAETPVCVDLSACHALESIGHYAFYGCSGTENVSLDDTVRYVGEYAFAMTGAQMKFFAEQEGKAENEFFITGDGVLLFAYIADEKSEIIVPDGVKVIAGAAFSGWDTAIVPENVDQLSASGKTKYNLSYTVTSIKLPDTLKTIGGSAFYRMLGLKSIVLPESLTFVDSYAFAFCEGLTSLSGGGNIEKIGDYAFYYCVSIPSFRFSSNTKEIGDSVFNGCAALKTVYFPENAELIGENIFAEGCAALTGINLAQKEKARIYAIVGAMTGNLKVAYYE